MHTRSQLLAAATVAALAGVAAQATPIRVATFNASLNRNSAGQLVGDLSTPGNAQARTIAEIIQRTNPDIILINEFDYDSSGTALKLFQQNYLGVGQNGAAPINFAYAFTAPSNTGIASGFDLDNNGAVGGPNDALGFGFFPGQFGMAVYSKYAIDEAAIRTFQNFKWKDMPGALLPGDPLSVSPDHPDWYSPAELAALPLSSKSHWDIPVIVGGETLHILTAHPTPPVFDGPEDRNGRRNHDEIRLWADYISGNASYLYDDQGGTGGLAAGSSFVILGDYNADPLDGDSVGGAVNQLLDSPFTDDSFVPGSAGGAEAAALQGGANATHLGNPFYDTGDFADTAPGNLRVDLVLGSAGTTHTFGGGVFWPVQADPLSRLTGVFPFPSSDHRLVYKDLVFGTAVPEPASWALMIGGFAVTGVAMRRRKAALVA